MSQSENSERKLTPAAQRALHEAALRRLENDRAGGVGDNPDRAEECGGRKGPEPTRYGDWEKKGLISDF